jgi:NTE family protein
MNFLSRPSSAVLMAITALWGLTLCTGAAAVEPASPEAQAAETVAPTPKPKRPKICLVLSGGGARGAAHTGVLRVLEDLRVPIDCIAGTSMGALVGGAYATGMSVDEMDAVNAGITVEKLFKEKAPRKELTMRRKQDDFYNFVGPEIGVGAEEAVATKGFVSGVQLESVLRQLTKVRGYRDFDSLPIPFRAVATDLVSGKPVVFSEGDISNVMRASMAVPGAVAPAEIGGLLLVDGMLTSNLPVAAARAMGADVVIAVNVGTPLLKREQLNGVLGVANQMLSILTEQNVQASLASLKPGDVLISPDLGDFSTADFDHLSQISPKGEIAARLMAQQLSRYAVSPEEYAALRQRQKAAVSADLRPVDELRFVNLKRVNPEAAASLMVTKAHAPIEQEVLDDDMRRLYGSGDFEHVNYRVLTEKHKRILAIEAMEKSWGPNYLRFGMGMSSDFGSESQASLFASYRRTWINSLGAEWRTDLRFGYNNSLSSEFYQPLDARQDWFVAPSLNVGRSTISVYAGDARQSIYTLVSGQVGLDLGRHFYQYGEFRLGLQRGRVSARLDTGDGIGVPRSAQIATGGVNARLQLDRLDSVLFPRSGWLAGVNLFRSTKGLGADESFMKWDASAAAAYTFGENTFNLALVGAGPMGQYPLPGHSLVQWGGFLQQSGYAQGQLLGQRLEFARLMYYRRVSQGQLLEGAYGGLSLELGRVTEPLLWINSEAWRKSVAVYVGLDTFVGPLYFGAGRASDGATSFYLVLGSVLTPGR